MTTATLSPSLLSQEERTYRAEQDVRKEIALVFTEGIRRIPVARLTLPGTSRDGWKEAPANLERVIADDISDPKPWAAFIEAMEKSDCPYVRKVREALAMNYADSHADEVAAIRSEA